jgi:hypothetical protein
MPPPSGQTFAGVTGAADDKTFVMVAERFPISNAYVSPSTTWYLLRIAPGASKLAALSFSFLRVSGQPAGTTVGGIALSPDGSKLAVYYGPAVWIRHKQNLLTLQLYSTSTGKVLRTWTHDTNGHPAGFGWYWGAYTNTSLTWLADGHTLAFEFGVGNGADGPPFGAGFADPTVRTLNLDGQGRDMITASKVVFRAKGTGFGCLTLRLTPDGKTVLCGSYLGGPPGSAAYYPMITAFSVATGKPSQLHHLPGTFTAALPDVLWSSPDGSKLVIAVYSATKTSAIGAAYHAIYRLANGKYTPMKFPASVHHAGAIAF